MLPIEKLRSLSREEKIELMKGAVSKKVDEILDRAVAMSVFKNKKDVRAIIDDDRYEVKSDSLEGYLYAHGYVVQEIKRDRSDDSSWLEVKFRIPEEINL